jgi:tight adherence protein B
MTPTVTVIAPLVCAIALGLLALRTTLGAAPGRRQVRAGGTPRPSRWRAWPRRAGPNAVQRPQGRRRQASPTVADCIAVVDHLARDLRAGSSTTAALGDALAAQPTVLVDLRRRLEQGGTAGLIAIEHVGAGTPHERLVLQALRVSRRAGGSGAGVLERTADTLREQQAWAHERRAHTAQARLSARVLTGLPIVFACWSITADDGVRRAYASSPLPALSAMVGGVLNLLGWWWMRRLIRSGP